MGMFEKKNFKQGTLSVAKAIALKSAGSAFGVVGGGETVAFLESEKLINKINFVSSGGGAMLAFLAGKPMPGLEAVSK